MVKNLFDLDPHQDLDYGWDLLYDIKTIGQLQKKIKNTVEELSEIIKRCRYEDFPIDDYVNETLKLEIKK